MIRLRLAHSLRPRAVPQTQPIPPLAEQLREECEAMARFALHHGLPIAPELIAQLDTFVDGQTSTHATPHYALTAIHRRLTAAIIPATSQAVTLLDARHRSDHPFLWLGPVPLIQLLTSIAIIFLIAVITTGMSPDVSSANINRGFLDSDGAPLLRNTLFLLFCAGLGTSFATLFQVHRYVAASTYDPKYSASYCARLILGVIAGLILVEMLSAWVFDRGSMHSFGKPALAMLGGFSTTAVYRLLQRLVDALETLVRDDRSADTDAAMQAYWTHAASEHTQWQSELAADLIELQQSSDGTVPPEAMRKRPADFMRAMLTASDPAAASPSFFSAGGPSKE